ncbi:hypothetical protein CGRA01v4_04444 [Colletotrichum graminicola]|uniref:2EXR domain-containing protein n=1 Tax=Colletotrichum graminicola (strain M1.001 / M2 / FGSC 10212) TaxID=645133 RepID=E3Q9J1_COLGM|nr:uncharacterized protein GLRG_01865 [Colletotrichum graminicola M1.001]EFQ27370.1 hypothetical protein GLRG_01865 [Colletotrichum graminicola M1.001]WDK13163.1 hypothetical protein CGRA01v4_04444 [Colletotrichum graminicola]
MEFFLFSKLPLELRIHIWKMTREPRMLKVEARVELNKHRRHPLDYTLFCCTSPNPVPAVLQTCRESRNLGLYERSFTSGLTPRYVWVNFQLDTIQATYWVLKLLKIEKERIRHLGIEFEDVEALLRRYREAVAGLRVVKTMELFTQEPLPERADIIEWTRDAMRQVSEKENSQFPRITLVHRPTGNKMN